MIICPVCKRKISSEQVAVRHYLACWKENNPYHTSKEAPHSENITTRSINSDVDAFFKEYK